MKVTSFLACHYGALTEGGFVDLAGIGIDRLDANRLPIVVSVKFFARCESEVNDASRKYKVNLHFWGDDKVLSKTADQFFETTDQRRNQNLLVDFLLKFDTEGDYRIDLLIDGQTCGAWPIAVRLRKAPSPPGGSRP